MKTKTLTLLVLTVVATFILSFVVEWNFSSDGFLSNADLTEGYEMSDFYNRVRCKRAENFSDFCEDVVIVSTDGCEIEKMPAVIGSVESFSPKTIGVDILFKKHADSIDRKIVAAINNCNSAFVARMTSEDNKHLIASPIFRDEDVLYAVVNVENRIIRHYWPKFKTDKGTKNSFALELVKQYNLEAFDKQSSRKKEKEHLCILKDFDCYTINYKELLNTNKADEGSYSRLLKDKIVIIGPVKDENDMHLTSINKIYPGTKIHAAIIHNILKEEYIDEHLWLNYSIATIMIVVFAWLVVTFRARKCTFANLLLRLFQLVFIFLGAYWGSLLYAKSHLYINLSIALLGVGSVYIGYDIAIAVIELFTKLTNLINHKKNKK